MERVNRTISVYSSTLLLPEVREHFEQFGHILNVYPWASKSSRMHYFIEFDNCLPDQKILKLSSPGVAVTFVAEAKNLSNRFLHLTTPTAPPSDPQSRKRCAEVEMNLGEKDTQEPDNERRKKRRMLRDPSGCTERQRKLVAGPSESSGIPLLLRSQRGAQTTPSLNSSFMASFRDLTIAPSGPDQDSLALKNLPISAASDEKDSGSTVSEAFEFSGQMMEDSDKSSTFWSDNRYLKKMHCEIKSLRKGNESYLAKLRAAKSAQHDAEYALREERERGKQFQSQLDSLMEQLRQLREDMDGMRKQFLKEAEVQREAEGCHVQAADVSLEQSS